MNKNEILAKSRQENMNDDECQKKRRTDQDAFSVWGYIIMSFIFIVLKLIQREPLEDVLSILWCGVATGFLYGAIHTKEKISVIATVAGYLLALLFLCKYCMEMF